MVFDVGTFVGNKRPTRLLCNERNFFINTNKNTLSYINSQAREITKSYTVPEFLITSVCEISKTVAVKK